MSTGSTTDEAARHREKMAKRKAVQDAEVAGKTIEKGLLIVHTGTGKGKSTAAFGLVMRALGHGFPVGIVQFVKGKWTTGERHALDGLSDDQERLARLHHSLKHGKHRLQARELLLVQQDVRVLQLGGHLLGVGDEVRREIAAVELHAFDDVELGFEALGLLNRDNALVADPLHGLSNLGPDLGVTV